jgi:signal transduction histidine kinase
MVQPRTRRDWAVDGLGFLLCAGFTAVTLLDGLDRQLATAPVLIEASLGALASLGWWLRRRRPVGFAVTAGLLGVYSVSAAGITLLGLFVVAVHRRFTVACLVAAGCGLVSLLTPLIRPDQPGPSVAQGVLSVACVAAVLAWGMYVRSQRQLAASRRARPDSEQELRVAQARQSERDRIAREMHDVLAHRISLVSLHAGALELWPDAPPDQVARAAGVIRESAHRALEDLRDVLGVLRAGGTSGAAERPQPTLADLPLLIEESRRAGTRVVLDCGVADLGAVPEAIGRAAYRVLQEGPTNARKHAGDAEVSVAVRGTAGADGLTVEVSNPCPPAGAAPAVPGAGAGIIGLTERAGLVGGRLEHGRTAAGRFRLAAWLPWPA